MNDYAFDSSGNTTKDANGRTFVYDAENKQTKVETVNSSGTVTGTIGEYFYDGDGRRVKKRGWINGQWEETRFVYDASSRLVAEYSTILNETPQVAYLTNDHLGSPRINTDENGAVISRHDYRPYGEEVNERMHTQYAADTIRKQFTGYERDGETELDFAQARIFQMNFGRFLVPDPTFLSVTMRNPQSWNRYTYVLNNPHLYTDPFGLWAMVRETIYKRDDKGNFVLDENGNRIVQGVFITFVKSKEGDDGNELARQLGLTGEDAERFAAFVGDATQVPVGEFLRGFARGDNKDLFNEISGVFIYVEERLRRQAEAERRRGPEAAADNGTANCAGTADTIAGGKNGVLMGPDQLDEIIKTDYRSYPEGELRIGDVIRYATKSGPKHFTSFLFRQDNGQPLVFSKSGDNGQYHVGTARQFEGVFAVGKRKVDYGQITGYFRRR